MKKKTHKPTSNDYLSNKEDILDLKNQLARALADYDNFRKRSEEEKKNIYKLANISVFVKLLPILDNLRSAMNHISDSGIAIIVGEIESLFKEEGFEEIKLKKGDLFDEKLAEAVDTIETTDKKMENTISEILLSGWRYSDQIVRYAKVKVYRPNLG